MSRISSTLTPLDLPYYVAGKQVTSHNKLEVFYPYTGELTGTLSLAGPADLDLYVPSCERRSRSAAPIGQKVQRCAALDADSGPIDADLAVLNERWPTLTEAVRESIMRLVRAGG